MTAEEIRIAYRVNLSIGYDNAITLLMRLGFTEYAADSYLYSRG